MEGLPKKGWNITRGPRHRYINLDPARDTHTPLHLSKFFSGLSILVLVLVSIAVFGAQWQRQPQRAGTISANTALSQSAVAAAAAASIRVWNSYTVGDRNGYELLLYPFSHVAEPHKTSVMTIDTLDINGFEATVRWAVKGVEVGMGASIENVFGSPGTYPCTATVSYALRPPGEEQDGAKGKTGARSAPLSSSPPLAPPDTVTHSFDVTVKYVRREIRDLTDRDRETFFNAVSVLQRVPSAVGREVFGDKFYSKDYFNRLHLHYGGQKDCDHWHDGAGFVTSHVALSLMFEQALQSIDPSIALPYWDFTIEGSLYDWTDFRSSGVFSDDWFGTAAPRNALMTPSRGRFGYVPVMVNATEYSVLHNSYGLLRSPWNSNRDPFMTRHDHLFGYANNRKPSGCKQYRDAALETSWMRLTEAMNAGAHGHIHELLGGAWASEWSGFYNRTEEIVLPMTHAIVPLMKYLWRANYIQCPATCNLSLEWVDCQCTLNEDKISGKKPSEVLESSGVLLPEAGAFFYDKDLKLIDNLADEEGKAYSEIPGYTKEQTEDIYAELLRVLSTPMRIGTHYEGTSTNDLTFFTIHNTFDRLWHLNRLEDVREGTFDETWRDGHKCYGHNPADVQPFHDLFLREPAGTTEEENQGQARVGGGREEERRAGSRVGGGVAPPKTYYTNQQLYELLKPHGMATPYMYNNFQWPHCEALGVYMRRRGL